MRMLHTVEALVNSLMQHNLMIHTLLIYWLCLLSITLQLSWKGQCDDIVMALVFQAVKSLCYQLQPIVMQFSIKR